MPLAVDGFGSYSKPSVLAPSYTGPAAFYSGATQDFYFKYADAPNQLNSSSTQATNGQGVQTSNPESGGISTLTGSQITAASQPLVTTNAIGSFQAVSGSGGRFFNLAGTGNTNCPRNTNTVSFTLVCKPTSLSGSNYFYFIFDNSFSFNRFCPYFFNNTLGLDCINTDGAAHSTILGTNGALTLNSWCTAVWEWNALSAIIKLYVNGVITLITSGSAPAGAKLVNTSGNQPKVISGVPALVTECSMFVDTLMGDTNVLAWHNAAKAYYGF